MAQKSAGTHHNLSVSMLDSQCPADRSCKRHRRIPIFLQSSLAYMAVMSLDGKCCISKHVYSGEATFRINQLQPRTNSTWVVFIRACLWAPNKDPGGPETRTSWMKSATQLRQAAVVLQCPLCSMPTAVSGWVPATEGPHDVCTRCRRC